MLRSHQNQGQQEAALAAALDTTAGTWLKTALARARSAAAS
ncbi:hypothetical protein [Streptomyces sp. SID5473]|nr:hypothetical protein [Streptomyces sp. SID5473]